MIKNKYSIKATISGLALALTIGVVGNMGSYAYFSDKGEARNDLVFTMGNLKTSIGNGLNVENLKANELKSKDFYITNEGSLKEIVTLTFNDIKVENGVNLSDLKYTLTVDGEIKVDCKLNELGNKTINIGVINPKNKFECKATIINTGNDSSIDDAQVSFNLQVDAKQIGEGSGVFTDKVVQSNTIKLAKEEIKDDTNASDRVAYFIGKNGPHKFDELIIPIAIDNSIELSDIKEELIVTGSQGNYTAEIIKDTMGSYISVKPSSGEFGVKESLNIIVKVYIHDKLKIDEIYRITKNSNGNPSHEDHPWHTGKCKKVKVNVTNKLKNLDEEVTQKNPEDNNTQEEVPSTGEDVVAPPKDEEDVDKNLPGENPDDIKQQPPETGEPPVKEDLQKPEPKPDEPVVMPLD